ncbi:MAG: HYR domain-containing protein [Verrucomicrobia bacterium]|nr:HYR domain-containing protein [Verrucomicrobiota bacterium]
MNSSPLPAILSSTRLHTAVAIGRTHGATPWKLLKWQTRLVNQGLAGCAWIMFGTASSSALEGVYVGQMKGCPTRQMGATPISGISAVAVGGGHMVALKFDGTVAAWGYNAYGQTMVPVGLAGVTAIAAGGSHTVALKQDGTVVAWGSNYYYGQATVPAGLAGVTAIAAGDSHTVALKQNGTVVAWGSNTHGQTTIPAGLTGVKAIAAGEQLTMALKTDGTVVAWGSTQYGQTLFPAGLAGVIAIAAGERHAAAVKSDGTVVAWGDNYYGETEIPSGLAGVTAIAIGGVNTLACKRDGTVVAWGLLNTVPAGLFGVTAIAAGRVGFVAIQADGAVVPLGGTAIPFTLNWISEVAIGSEHAVALRENGTVVAWGSNHYGQSAVPTGLAGVKAIAAGGNHTVALREDGTVVAWGGNDYGQATVPAGLVGVTAIAAGYYHTVALKQDGTVDGLGTTVPAGLSGVTAIAVGHYQTVALKQDGTVVGWDSGFSVPAGLSGVTAIAAGYNYAVALKQDGTVAAWGLNDYGQTTVPAGLTGVKAIGAGDSHSVALKLDGTVVAWGRNSSGETTVPAGLTGVIAISVGRSHTVARKADGTVVAWGANDYGQTTVPAGLPRISKVVAAQYGTFYLYELPAITEYTLGVGGHNASASQSPLKARYALGETVSVTALPDPGFTFEGWMDGESILRGNPVSVIMTGNLTLRMLTSRGVTPLHSTQSASVPLAGSLAAEPSHTSVSPYGIKPAVILTGNADNSYDIAYHAAGTSTIRILNYDRAGNLTAQLEPAALAGAKSLLGLARIPEDGSFAVAYSRDSALNGSGFEYWISRVSATGAAVFSTLVFGDQDRNSVNSKGDPGGFSSGRLVYHPAIQKLICYVGHTMRWNDGVRHQGGFLGYLSLTGSLTTIHNWYFSHNFDQRLLVDGGNFFTLAHGDAYPRALGFGKGGSTLSNYFSIPGAIGDNTTSTQTGGFVKLPNGNFGVVFSTAIGRNNYDVCYTELSTSGTTVATNWLTSYPAGTFAIFPKIARYGDGAAIFWEEVSNGKVTAVRTRRVGSYGVSNLPLGTLSDPAVRLSPYYDLASLPNGDILWASQQGNQALSVVRVAADPLDATPPVLSLPRYLNAAADGPAGAAVTFSIGAVDAVDGEVTVTAVPASGSRFPLGTTTVQVSASDATGNRSSGSFQVRVVNLSKLLTGVKLVPATTTAPARVSGHIQQGPAGGFVLLEASSDLGVLDPWRTIAPIPLEAAGSALFGPLADPRSTGLPRNFFRIALPVSGTVGDYTAPTLILPEDIVVGTSNPAGAVVDYVVSASDLVDGSLPAKCKPVSGTRFLIGTTLIRASAIDAAGNTANGSFNVTLVDMSKLLRNIVIHPAGPRTAAGISGTVNGGPPLGVILLQASSDLGRTDPWETIGAVPLDAAGHAVFGPLSDPHGTGLTRGFFRAALP